MGTHATYSNCPHTSSVIRSCLPHKDSQWGYLLITNHLCSSILFNLAKLDTAHPFPPNTSATLGPGSQVV